MIVLRCVLWVCDSAVRWGEIKLYNTQFAINANSCKEQVRQSVVKHQLWNTHFVAQSSKIKMCWSQPVLSRSQNLASKTKQPFYWDTRRKCCITLQNSIRRYLSPEVSVKNESTSVRASVFSAGCASKQKKSSSWLALPQTLSVSCDVVAVCCCTAVAYSYVKLRDAAVLASPSQCSLNCSKVTLAMISSLRSLHLVNRVPRTDKIASVSGLSTWHLV